MVFQMGEMLLSRFEERLFALLLYILVFVLFFSLCSEQLIMSFVTTIIAL